MNRDSRDPKVLKAARMYEEQFLREMLSAMKKAVPDGGLLKKNMAEKIFQEKLDHTHVEEWTDRGGVGLADLIYDNIMKRAQSMQAMPRPRGPMSLEEKSAGFKVLSQTNTSGQFAIQSKGKDEVLSPWKAKVESVMESMLLLNHGNGILSAMSFGSGEPSVVPGQIVESGQRVALLGEGANEYFWNLRTPMDP